LSLLLVLILLLLLLLTGFLIVSLEEALDLGPSLPHFVLIFCEFEHMLNRAALRGLVRFPLKHRYPLRVRFSECTTLLINLRNPITFEILHMFQEPLLLVHQVKHGIVIELMAILQERPREQMTRVELTTEL
jgi:hypothetical protein